MLTIKTTTGRQFDLLPGTKLSIEENSPLFSDAGSFSLPVELPETDNNLRILDYPYRADRRQKFVTSLDVVISAGVWIRHARMDIESSGRKRNITASLFFRESPFYAKIKNKRLPDLFKNKIRDDFADQTEEHKHSFWRNYLDKVMCGDVVDDFYIFQVCAKYEDKEESEGDQNISLKTTYTRYTILNRLSVPFKTFTGNTSQTTDGKTYYNLVGVESAYTQDGVEYYLPDGYGKCPFLKFTYVVRYMFQQLGYKLQPGIFDTDEGFRRLCFIHNTADCLIRGFLDYSQIVPDVELNDFLQFIENSFGLRFIIDETAKTATPRFWKDILTDSPVVDISGVFNDYPSITFSDPKSLKLTIERVVPAVNQSGMKTFSELFEKYGSYRGSFKNKMELNIAMSRGEVSQGVYLIRDSAVYYVVFKYYRDPINQPGIFDWVSIPVETDTLEFYDHNADSFDERPLGFYLVDMKHVALSGQTDPRHEVTVSKMLKALGMEEIIQKALEQFKPDDGLIGRIPYIDSIRHLNSVMETASTKDDVTTTTITEEKETSLPIFLAFSHGFAAVDPDRPNIERTFYASPDACDNVGNKVGTFDLSTRGLHTYFWKEYDSLLHDSFHEITGQGKMNLSDILGFRFDMPMSLNGQKVLAESIQYELSDDGVEVPELKVKTIKQYE